MATTIRDGRTRATIASSSSHVPSQRSCSGEGPDLHPEFSREVAIYPLAMGGVAIIASIIGALAVRTKTDNVEGALYQGLIVCGGPLGRGVLPDHRVDDGGPAARVGDAGASGGGDAARHRPLALRADRPGGHRRCSS